jgi:translation initiation factor IF-3
MSTIPFAFYLLTSLSIKKLRINNQIRASSVKLIKEGIGLVEVPLEEAMKMAQESGLDLVEVDGMSVPPVCKIMDYGKHMYKQKKLEQKNKKLQKQVEVKGVRIGFGTGEHDLLVKEKQARRFLDKKNQVRVFLILKGREMSHMDMAKDKIIAFCNRLSDVSKMELEPSRQAGRMMILLTPLK